MGNIIRRRYNATTAQGQDDTESLLHGGDVMPDFIYPQDFEPEKLGLAQQLEEWADGAEPSVELSAHIREVTMVWDSDTGKPKKTPAELFRMMDAYDESWILPDI